MVGWIPAVAVRGAGGEEEGEGRIVLLRHLEVSGLSVPRRGDRVSYKQGNYFNKFYISFNLNCFFSIVLKPCKGLITSKMIRICAGGLNVFFLGGLNSSQETSL